MTAMTNEEVRASIESNQRSTGIKLREQPAYQAGSVYYDDPEANAFFFESPLTADSAAYTARIASLLGAEGESMFYGALLWITLYDIWSPQVQKTGWAMIEMMRRGFGENRPLEAAPGHWFRNGAAVELAAFVLPCFVFGWDAFIIPAGDNNFFVHISHDEYWAVVTRNDEARQRLLPHLADLGPREEQALLQRFCPRSKYLTQTTG